jgi:hypothetical protein
MDRRRWEPVWNVSSGSPALSDPQATELEGVAAGELPERLRSANAQRGRNEQLRGGQGGVAENISTTGTDQSERGPEPGGGAARNTDGTSLGCRSGVTPETGHHEPDQIVTDELVPPHGARVRQRNQSLLHEGALLRSGGRAVPKRRSDRIFFIKVFGKPNVVWAAL